MYLSRLILNPRNRALRRDLADCQALHRTIMSAFPDLPTEADARARLGVLFRLDVHPRSGIPTVLVQSRERPDWSRLDPDYFIAGEPELPNPAVKSVVGAYDSLAEGTELLFRLRANPTRRIGKSGDGTNWKGKRVELRDEASRLDWLGRKGGQGGFMLLSVRAHSDVAGGVSPADVRTVEEVKLTGRRPDPGAGGARLTFGSVLFEGRLRVTNAALFREMLERGIGSGKAYGFGLLSIARPTG